LLKEPHKLREQGVRVEDSFSNIKRKAEEYISKFVKTTLKLQKLLQILGKMHQKM
jgi:hypothetical protein